MRLIALAMALTLAWGGSAGAQESASRSATPPQPVRPADVVAQLARKALSTPRDTTTWGALARSIPDLALEGGADLESTFEAARLADSVAAGLPREVLAARARLAETPAPAPRVRTLAEAATHGLSVGLDLAEDPRVAVPTLAVLLLALVLVHGSQRRRPERPTTADSRGRVWTVRTLASGGVEIQEIARRTGLAQDAVRMALGMGATVPGGTALMAPSPSARPRRSAAEARLRREVAAGARRFRDGRLTYGGRGR